jgi:hypothetical protein
MEIPDGDAGVGIDAARIDVAQQDQHQEPELRPFMGAFRFQGHDRTAGIFRRLLAMLGGKVGSQTIEVSSRHRHAGKHDSRR